MTSLNFSVDKRSKIKAVVGVITNDKYARNGLLVITPTTAQ
jgi:hypothetical protein